MNTEIISSKPKIPRITRKISLRLLSFLPFFPVYFSPSLIPKYARHIYPTYCHGRCMNNIDTSRLHSILLSLFLSFFITFFVFFILTSLPPLPYFFHSHSRSIPIFYLFSFLFPFFWHFYVSFYLSICLLSSILFLFVYCLYSPFSILRCFHSPCFRLPGRESELRSTGQQLHSSGLFTHCYLALDSLFR